jgi:hypothetical protein
MDVDAAQPVKPLSAAVACQPSEGPIQPQLAHARARTDSIFLDGSVGQVLHPPNRRTYPGDLDNPQRLRNHPDISVLMAGAVVPEDTGQPRLPGRPVPPSWDGEPGPGAPGVV